MKNNTVSKKKTRKKRLVCPIGAGVEIAKKFDVTVQTVSAALNFKTDSIDARNIRQYAVNAYNAKKIFID